MTPKALVGFRAIRLHPPGSLPPEATRQAHTIAQPDPLLLIRVDQLHFRGLANGTPILLLSSFLRMCVAAEVHIGVLDFFMWHLMTDNDCLWLVLIRGEILHDLLFRHHVVLALREVQLQRVGPILQIRLRAEEEPLDEGGRIQGPLLEASLLEFRVTLFRMVSAVLSTIATLHGHCRGIAPSAPQLCNLRCCEGITGRMLSWCLPCIGAQR
mmetsp:Transcript_29214/g.47258  ORF Transcript_29214/g.47258 Transcript_29214/m.47258 type:complete len:212 (-) Transcript_29214:143-778(-)